jgi:hypothetical protein
MGASRVTMVPRAALALLGLLGIRSESAHSQSWKTYTDTVHRYAFSYPPGYQIRESRGSLVLDDRKGRTEFYVENWTRSVTQGREKWDMAKLAPERAVTACMADGPGCSINCTVKNLEDVQNSHGVHVVRVTRNRVDTCARTPARALVPVYVADLSGNGTYFLLVVAPEEEPGVAPDVLRSIVATIRRVER